MCTCSPAAWLCWGLAMLLGTAYVAWRLWRRTR